MAIKGAVLMSENELRLLSIIRQSKDPAAVLVAAMEAVTVCLRQPEPCGAPSPADPASAAGTAS